MIHSCDHGEHFVLDLIATRDIAGVRSLAPGFWTDGKYVYLQETCYTVLSCFKKIDTDKFCRFGVLLDAR